MKKIFVLLLISVFLLTGCNVRQINPDDLNKVTDLILSKNLNLYNRTSNGYKYYAPRGMRVIDNTDFNEKLFSNGDTYYLYVDVVNYFFKKDFTYKVNEDAYFSKELNYRNNKGYLEITKIKNMYFVEMMFNYSKIEVFVPKEDISVAVMNASYILGSVKFNDVIIKTLFDENSLNFSEEQFKLFEPKRKEGNFLDYVNEYDQYEGTIDDEDLIAPEDLNVPNNETDDLLEEGENYETN